MSSIGGDEPFGRKLAPIPGEKSRDRIRRDSHRDRTRGTHSVPGDAVLCKSSSRFRIKDGTLVKNPVGDSGFIVDEERLRANVPRVVPEAIEHRYRGPRRGIARYGGIDCPDSCICVIDHHLSEFDDGVSAAGSFVVSLALIDRVLCRASLPFGGRNRVSRVSAGLVRIFLGLDCGLGLNPGHHRRHGRRDEQPDVENELRVIHSRTLSRVVV